MKRVTFGGMAAVMVMSALFCLSAEIRVQAAPKQSVVNSTAKYRPLPAKKPAAPRLRGER